MLRITEIRQTTPQGVIVWVLKLEGNAPLLGKYAPAMLQPRRAYPLDKAADLEESFYWLRYELDGRPNYTLRHRLALPVGSTTSQAIAGLIPVPQGTVVFYQSRVSTDQVAGFESSVKKGGSDAASWPSS